MFIGSNTAPKQEVHFHRTNRAHGLADRRGAPQHRRVNDHDRRRVFTRQQPRQIVECQDDENPAACSMACAREDLHAGYVAYDDCSFVECLSTCWM
jgi:hypothetical protein